MIRRNIKPHLIISSPFQRTVETARPTQEHYDPDVLPYDITRETGLLRSGKSSSVLYIHTRIREFSYLNDQAYNGTSREERIRAKQEYFRIGDPDYIDGRVGKDGEILGTFAESFNQACRDVYLFARILLDIESKMREARLLSEDEELTVLAFSHEQRMDIVRLLATYPEAMQQLKNNPAIVLSKEMGEKLMAEFYRIAIDLPPDKKPESPIPNGHIMETRISPDDASIMLLNEADKIPPPIAVQAIDAPPLDPFSQPPPATPSVSRQSRKGRAGHGPKR